MPVIYAMRRGTPAAIHFGTYLRNTRLSKGLTLAQIAEYLGTYSSVPSQIETGQRVLKEAKLEAWAEAYGVGSKTFRRNWIEACTSYPQMPLTRNRGTAITVKNLDTIFSQLTANERSRVQGYIEAIIEGREN